MSEQKVTVRGTAWWAQFTLLGGILAAVLLILGPIGYRLGVVGVEGAVLLLPGTVPLGTVPTATLPVGSSLVPQGVDRVHARGGGKREAGDPTNFTKAQPRRIQ